MDRVPGLVVPIDNRQQLAAPTMRMHRTYGPLKFSLLRRGDDYAYFLLDRTGNRLLRVDRDAGRLTVYDHVGNVNTDAESFARDMNAIVEVLTNDIATPRHIAYPGSPVSRRAHV